MKQRLLWPLLGFISPIFLVNTIYHRSKKEVEPDSSILVLSMRASGGHDAAAKALKKRFEQLSVPTKIIYVDDYDYFGGAQFYDNMMRTSVGRNIINLINKIYWYNGENYLSFSYNLFANEDLKRKYNPICVVSVVPFSYKVLQNLKEQYPNLKTFILPTDVYNPYQKYWISGNDTDYLLGSKILMEEAFDKPHKKEISGMILRPEFTENIQSKEERRKQLGIFDSRPLITLLFGATGSDQMEDLMHKIIELKLDQKYLFAFITGKNELLRKRLELLKSQNNLDCLIKGYESEIHLWMQASNILVGKAGPGVIAECQASRLPMIAIEKDVLEQEVYNLEIVRNMGMCIKKYEEFENAIEQILNNSIKYEQLFDQLPKNNALNEAIEVILQKCFGHFMNEQIEDKMQDLNLNNLQNLYLSSAQPLQVGLSKVI